MTPYQKFRKLNIDFAVIGLELTGTEEKYFCTPKGARIIASAGVDGIHYCFVRGQGETVFAVSPMNETGRNVFPIARTFEDLLGLLMACGSMDAIEQAWQWDEEQFEEYLAAYPAKSEAMAAFDVLQAKLGITPMENPYAYLQELQRSYNYGQLNFSKEYYDLLFAAPAEWQPPAEWKVTVDGGFCPERGKGGREIRIDKKFTWGEEIWHVPAVYVCSTGLVADFCISVNEDQMRAYYEKYKVQEERGIPLTEEEEETLLLDCPTDISFKASVSLNGQLLPMKRGSGRNWIAPGIYGEDVSGDAEAKWVLEHYGLDVTKSWVIRRCSFVWEGRRKVDVQSLQLKLERRPVKVPGIHFHIPAVGECFTFENPVTGLTHKLTVRAVETGAMDEGVYRDETMEFPCHYTAMTYTVDPELSREQFRIKECGEGDRPRPKPGTDRGQMSVMFGVPGVMYYADGLPKFYEADGKVLIPQTCISHLYFDSVPDPIEWRMVFHEKRMEDIEVELI